MEIAYFLLVVACFFILVPSPFEGSVSTHTHTFLRWNERPLFPSVLYFFLTFPPTLTACWALYH